MNGHQALVLKLYNRTLFLRDAAAAISLTCFYIWSTSTLHRLTLLFHTHTCLHERIPQNKVIVVV